MIELAGVSKSFSSGRRSFVAVDAVSLTVAAGSATILMGPSGSGKTTLLTLIGCMTRPSSGRIRLSGIAPPFATASTEEGLDISSLPERFLTAIRRQTFGFIFQQFNLVRGITVLENIMLPAYPLGEEREKLHDRALALLRELEMQRHADAKVEWLSGGEMQRVAIARALVNDPAVLIADEPTAHLDTARAHELMEILGHLKGRGKTIIIASHDPIACQWPLADRVVEMRDGRVVAEPR